jgi:glutamate-1-semialdehyde 2,1-aminomutase
MTNPHADAPPPASAPGRPRPAAQADDGVPEYAVAYICHNFPARLPADELRALWLTVENRGKRPWEQGSVKVAVDLNGVRCVELKLPHPAGPGERVTLHWTFRLPGEVGRHEFKFELMGQGGTTFGQHSVPPLYVPFEVTEQPATYARRLRDFTLETCSWYWFPADEGISWSSTGRGYPVFAREARGCRITDLEGRRYVDYLMGWGCALLGYAHERVRRAVANALGSGPLLSMAHHLMPEVAEALCKRFPGAGAVTFGKNGSDVCTAAVRLARAHTGRPGR